MAGGGIHSERTSYQGEISDLVIDICERYQLGNLKSHAVIEIGYEDLNIHLTTSTGDYVTKVFSKERDYDAIARYVEILEQVLNHGVHHPKINQKPKGRAHGYARGT